MALFLHFNHELLIKEILLFSIIDIFLKVFWEVGAFLKIKKTYSLRTFYNERKQQSLHYFSEYHCINQHVRDIRSFIIRHEITIRGGGLKSGEGGEKGQPHQSIVRTTFSLFSRPNHLEILVLSIFFFKVSDP